MKKMSFFFVTFLTLFFSTSCDSYISQDQYDDRTELWPAADKKGGKFGYINKLGTMVIPARYKAAYVFSSGLAKVVTLDNKIQFINKHGGVVFTLPEEYYSIGNTYSVGNVAYVDVYPIDNYFYNGYLRFGLNGYWGMYDKNFNMAIPAQYYELGHMSKEGVAHFVQTGLAGFYTEGFLNASGDVILYSFGESGNAPFYITSTEFCDGRAIVETFGENRKFGAINTSGELVIDTIYDDLYCIGGGLLGYMYYDYYGGHKYGIMDVDGNIITEPIFYGVRYMGDNDLLAVKYDNEKWGYVDKAGNQRIAPIFDECGPFYDGVAVVYMRKNNEDGEWSAWKYFPIDTDGNILWDFEPNEELQSCYHHGLALVKEMDFDNNIARFKYVNKNKKVIYCWETPFYISPARMASASHEEQMLHMYEGTEIYPMLQQRYKSELSMRK